MYTLQQSLQDEDRGRLKIIAELWGIELPQRNGANILPDLVRAMLQPDLALEIVTSLPVITQQALNALLAAKSPLVFADFNRTYGPLREMGPGRRDREKPWRNPISPLEELWYRGLVAKTFLHGPHGHLEYALVPDDLAANLPAPPRPDRSARLGPTTGPTQSSRRGDELIEDLVTLLAYLRLNPGSSLITLQDALSSQMHDPETIAFLQALMLDLGLLLPEPLRVDPQQAQRLLVSSHAFIRHELLHAWLDSTHWNDLAHVPGLDYPEGEWPNDPRRSRNGVLTSLGNLPENTWQSLSDLTAAIKAQHPSFQRPAGDFDSWYIRKEGSDQYLRGFLHWDDVEGGLIRFIIQGPLHWLGLMEVAANSSSDPDSMAFRLLDRGDILKADAALVPAGEEEPPNAIIKSNGDIVAPRGMQPHARYQIARCARWNGLDRKGYHYQLTPASLAAVVEQGLELKHILSILTKAGGQTVPPALSHAIKRWSLQGKEAGLEHVLILRVARSEILDELRKNRAVSRYIVERLGPTTAVVPASAWPKLIQTATENRILIEPPEPLNEDA